MGSVESDAALKIERQHYSLIAEGPYIQACHVVGFWQMLIVHVFCGHLMSGFFL